MVTTSPTLFNNLRRTSSKSNMVKSLIQNDAWRHNWTMTINLSINKSKPDTHTLNNTKGSGSFTTRLLYRTWLYSSPGIHHTAWHPLKCIRGCRASSASLCAMNQKNCHHWTVCQTLKTRWCQGKSVWPEAFMPSIKPSFPEWGSPTPTGSWKGPWGSPAKYSDRMQFFYLFWSRISKTVIKHHKAKMSSDGGPSSNLSGEKFEYLSAYFCGTLKKLK